MKIFIYNQALSLFLEGYSMNLAPIVLFAYNRLWHTKQTIESLLQNAESAESELYIFSDGPKNEIAAKQVTELREYLKQIAGFNKVHIIFHEENLGLANSIISGVTEILSHYDKIIVLEDDLISSPFFLKYMNDSLNLYEKDSEVIAVHGYTPPVDTKNETTFFLKGADSWGWGTWRRSWALFEKDGKKLLNELKAKKLLPEFNYHNSYPYTQMLIDQIDGKNNSWAIRWQAVAFIHNGLSLYPGKSLIKNIGLDGSGTHCSSITDYETSLHNLPISVERIALEQNNDVFENVASFLRGIHPTLLQKLLSKLKRMISKL
jgi:glycosyltransferase involved in cell wall biosynthesis